MGISIWEFEVYRFCRFYLGLIRQLSFYSSIQVWFSNIFDLLLGFLSSRGMFIMLFVRETGVWFELILFLVCVWLRQLNDWCSWVLLFNCRKLLNRGCFLLDLIRSWVILFCLTVDLELNLGEKGSRYFIIVRSPAKGFILFYRLEFIL